jgi:F0F1-type ATP synthase assembly protein I
METPKKDPTENRLKSSSRFLKFSAMAMQMLGTILIFTYAGYKLDNLQANATPIWTLVLSLTGIGGSLYLMIRSISKN